MRLLLFFLPFAFSFAYGNRFKYEMFYLHSFYYYNRYLDPRAFVRKLDLVANNYLSLVKKINNELNGELREASGYDLKSVNVTTNQSASEIINKMQARQIVVDLILYQIQFCHRMYTNATAKYTGDQISVHFDDLNFDDPMNRMIIYEWVNQMGILLNKTSEIGEKISETWKMIKEEINTNADGVEQQQQNGEKSPGSEATPQTPAIEAQPQTPAIEAPPQTPAIEAPPAEPSQ